MDYFSFIGDLDFCLFNLSDGFLQHFYCRRKRNTADSGYGSEQPLDRRWSQEFSQEVGACREEMFVL